MNGDMKAFETIRLTLDARGVATLTLSRPEKHNALNALMLREITEATQVCAASEKVRAVILAAEGKSFCAGGDLGWMRDQARQDRAAKIAEARVLSGMLYALNTLPKPLIGRVQGNAFGGGLGLIAVCDLAFAVPSAKFALTETKLGLIPATIGPFVVARLGAGFSRQIFFTAKSFGTEFALRSGLIASAADDLDGAIEAEIAAILRTAPGAAASAKALCQRLGGEITPEALSASIEALADRWESGEAKAGIAAFFEGQSPPWCT